MLWPIERMMSFWLCDFLLRSPTRSTTVLSALSSLWPATLLSVPSPCSLLICCFASASCPTCCCAAPISHVSHTAAAGAAAWPPLTWRISNSALLRTRIKPKAVKFSQRESRKKPTFRFQVTERWGFNLQNSTRGKFRGVWNYKAIGFKMKTWDIWCWKDWNGSFDHGRTPPKQNASRTSLICWSPSVLTGLLILRAHGSTEKPPTSSDYF